MSQYSRKNSNYVSLVWFVLLVVVNGQTTSLILSNLEDTTQTAASTVGTDQQQQQQQQSGQPVIAECQLLTGAMEDYCEVNTLQGLIEQSQEKISNCCELASQIQENECYDPCEQSQTISLWSKSICQLNSTAECSQDLEIVQQQQQNNSQSLEFRAARDEQYLGLQPIEQSVDIPATGDLSSTFVLDYPATTAEDFAKQLQDAVDFQSNLANGELANNQQQQSTVVLGSGVNEQVPPILQSLSNVDRVSISYELFRQVPEIVDEFNSDKSFTLLVPTDDAWELFATQQQKSVNEIKADQQLVSSILLNHIGWGMAQFANLERQQDALLLTLGGSQLTVSRSALSGSIVVRGCCDVENTAKVTDVDFDVDPTFAVHLVNRIVLSDAAFKIIQGASGVSVSPVTLPISPSSSPVETSSPSDATNLVTQNDNDSDNTTPMSLQELRDLVANLPTNLYIPEDFIPIPTSTPTTSPLPLSLPSPSSTPSVSIPSPSSIQSSVSTISEITRQIENAQPATQFEGTLRLGQQQIDNLEQIQEQNQQQLLEKVEYVVSPGAEFAVSDQNSSAAQLVVQEQIANVFDSAPVGAPSVPSGAEENDEQDSEDDSLPADIVEIMSKVRNNKCENVSDVLANDPKLNNFQVILQETDLMRVLDDLSEELYYTLFAPSNEGFEKLIQEGGPSVEPSLTNSTFMEFLLSYHVIPNQVFLAGVTSGTVLQTTLEQGNEPLQVTIKSYGSSLTVIEGVGSSAVVEKTLEACNVIIHVIDTVLIPFA